MIPLGSLRRLPEITARRRVLLIAMETEATTQVQTVEIGRDRVTISENELTIDAIHEMPDWQIREFKASPIYFQEKKYLLIARNRGEKPFAWRYILKPWPEDAEAGKGFFTYDAEAVAERDAAHRGGVRSEVVSTALLPFYPFLGFLWSGIQRRLERIGYVAHTITGISIFAGFGLLFAHASVAVVLINGSIRSGKIALGGIIRLFTGADTLALGALQLPVFWLDLALFVALLLDVLIRYSRYLGDHDWCGGFLEWIVRRAPKDSEKAEAS